MKMYSVAAIATIAITFASCSRNDDFQQNAPLNYSENIEMLRATPPAYHIAQSEKVAMPANVIIPENTSRVATYFAVGVQKYRSQIVSTDPMMYQWVFVAPEADLYDIGNRFVGTHYAGPKWKLDNNTDSIWAQQFTPARTAPSPDQNSIDWLLLKPKDGTTPTGIFADVDYIQRIVTSGGKAPVLPPTIGGETIEVPYTAIYRFSKIN